MLAPTHSVFGIFLTLTILAIFGVQASLHWTIILAGIIGSLAPDLDMPKSIIGRLFPFISKPLERKFGHRTITHSLLGWLAATLIFGVFTMIIMMIFQGQSHRIAPTVMMNIWRLISAFSISYLSHLILDMFTLRGSQLFWPEQSRDVIPKNPKYRIETGSKFELVIFTILLGCMIASFPLSKYGLSTSLRWLLATPDSVIAEFKTLTTRTHISFTGIVNQTKAPIIGQAEILDVKGSQLIILLGKDAQQCVSTISEDLTSDITETKIQFQKTDTPIQIEHKAFEDKTRDYLLANLPDNVLISGTIYLPFGLKLAQMHNTINTDARPYVSTFTTIEQLENTLILNFASKKQLENLALDEEFEYQLKANQLQLKAVNLKINRIQAEISLSQPTSNALLEDLTQQLEELQLEKEVLNLKLEATNLIFSGDVYLRRL
jgi:membrane-bound metal-dependent hydrolase YbcI (DUF457 family)